MIIFLFTSSTASAVLRLTSSLNLTPQNLFTSSTASAVLRQTPSPHSFESNLFTSSTASAVLRLFADAFVYISSFVYIVYCFGGIKTTSKFLTPVG